MKKQLAAVGLSLAMLANATPFEGSIAETTIDVASSSFPPELPANIAKFLPAVVAVDIATNPAQPKDSDRVGSGTDIQIGSTDYTLTAGHVLSIGTQLWKPGTYGCPANFQINGTSPDRRSTVLGAVGEFTPEGSDSEDISKPDVALLKLNNTPPLVVPESQIGAPTELGEEVIFTNWQNNPIAHYEPRDPMRHDKDNQPVEFPGRVIGIVGSDALILTGIASYGAHSDDKTYYSASGGPIWVEEDIGGHETAQLFGISNGGLLTGQTATQIEGEYNIQITGARNGQEFYVDHAYITQPQALESIQRNLEPCTTQWVKPNL